MNTGSFASKIWAAALICGLLMANIPPHLSPFEDARASWFEIGIRENDNVFREAWSNSTDPNSTLREEPLSLFVTSSMDDLDTDMRSEFVTGDASGHFYVYEFTNQDDIYTEVYSNTTGGTSLNSLFCGDLDGDGDKEIVCGDDNNMITIFEWDGNPGSDNYTLANSTDLGGEVWDLVIQDLDNDLTNELVVGWSGGITIFSFNQTYHFRKEYHYGTGSPIRSVAVGDFNGDMWTDVAAGEQNFSSLYLFEPVAPDIYFFTLASPIQMAPADAQRTPLALLGADLDQDGIPELFSGDDKGELNVIWTEDDLINTTFARLDTLGNAEIWDLASGDADGDANMDLYAAASHNESVFDYEYTGPDPTSPGSYVVAEVASGIGSAAEPYPRAISSGDPDTDLKGDLVIGTFGNSSDTMLFVYERDVPDNDATVLSINYPADGDTLPTGFYKVNATVKNMGAALASFNVNCTIMDAAFVPVFNSRENDVILLSGGMAYVEYDMPPWGVNQQGTYHINVTTEWEIDNDVTNDYRNITVHISNIYDLAVTEMDIDGVEPLGEGENLSVSATIYNNGTMKASNASVHLRINDSQGYQYNDTDQNVTLSAGDTTVLEFTPAWAPPAEGAYTLNVSIMWPLDNNVSNNVSTLEVLVENDIDISCNINELKANFKQRDPGDGREVFARNTNVVVNGTVQNLGNKKETFEAILNITDDQGQSVHYNTTNVTLGKGKTTFVEFSTWNTSADDDVNYTINMTVREEDENQPTDNNHSERSILVWDRYDLNASDIALNRSQPLLSNASLTINVTVGNSGNINVSSYDLNLTVKNGTDHIWHSQDKHVDENLVREGSSIVYFQLTTPDVEDTYYINITVIHGNDQNASNNFTTAAFIVDDDHDIAVHTPGFEGLLVAGYYPTGNHNLSAVIENKGNRNESFNASIKVGRSSGNNETIMSDDMENGSGNWSHFSVSGQDLWHQVDSGSPYPSNHSAETSWWFGDDATGHYFDDSDSILYYELDLREAFYATVSFWMNHSFEENNDYCHLVVNSESGLDPVNASWTRVDGPYTGSSGGWAQRLVNLSQYAGRRIHVGFNVETDSASSVFHGIYIDDLSLEITRFNFVHESSTVLNLESGKTAVVNDNYNFASEGIYLMLIGSHLNADEEFANDVVVKRIDILNYHDMGTTKVSLISERNELLRNSYDFENQNGGDWTGGGDGFNWQRGMPMSGPMGAISGFNTLCTNAGGFYAPNSSAWIRTPLLQDVSWGSRAEFWMWYRTNGTGSDLLRFQVSSDGGAGWETLREYTGASSGWVKHSIPFGDHFGNIYLRLLLISNESGEDDGFYLDDFSVISMDPSHAGEEARFNVTIENFGNVEETNPDVAISVSNADNPGFSHSARVNVQVSLLPGESHTFSWSYHPPANHTDHEEDFLLYFDTDLPGDKDQQNDRSFGIANVWNYTDIEIVRITEPDNHRAFRQGDRVKITARIRNRGTWDWNTIPVNFTMEFDNGSTKIKYVEISLLRNTTTLVSCEFDVPFGQGRAYGISVNFDPNKVMDMDPTNNRKNIALYGLNVPNTPAIFGYVTSDFSGLPVEGALVTVSTGFGEIDRATTDRNGFYTLTQPGIMDPVRITASKDGFISATKVRFIPSGECRLLDLVIEVDNTAPKAEITSSPAFALPGDLVEIGVKFVDLNGRRAPHTFNVSSNISGVIELQEPLDLDSESFTLITSQMPAGHHRITVNISDPYSFDLAHFDIAIFEPEIVHDQYGQPFAWLRSLYGGNGTVSLRGNTTIPANCTPIPAGLAHIGQFAGINVSGGDGRILWTEILFEYDTDALPPGSYVEDLAMYMYDPAEDHWEEAEGYVMDEENGLVGINMTHIPRGAVFAPLAARDIKAPEVLSTEPGNGAGDVPVDMVYSITFNELMDNDTVAEGINVTFGDGNTAEFTHVAVDDLINGTTTLLLSIKLDHEKTYKVVLRSPLGDLAGNPVNGTELTFRTVKKPITTGRLRVFVTNESGAALEKFVVQVLGFKNKFTSASGEAYFEPEAGEYDIKVKGKVHEGIEYDDWLKTVEIEANTTRELRVTMYEKYVSPQKTWGILSGNITDGENNSLVGVDIVIRLRKETWDTIVVGSGNNSTEGYTDFERIDNEIIRVRNVTIEYVRTALSGELGSFSEKLEMGTYNLTFILYGYETVTMEVNVTDGGELTDLNVTMAVKPPFGYITFTVVSIKDKPLELEAEITLRLEGEYRSFNVSDLGGGEYRSESLNEGAYILTVHIEGYEDNVSRIWVTADVDGWENELPGIVMWSDRDMHPGDKKNSTNTVIFVALIIFILLVLALAIFFIVTRSKDDKKEDEDEKEEKEGEKEPEEEGSGPVQEISFKCPECGADVEEDSDLCDSCGAEYEVPVKVGGEEEEEGGPKVKEEDLDEKDAAGRDEGGEPEEEGEEKQEGEEEGEEEEEEAAFECPECGADVMAGETSCSECGTELEFEEEEDLDLGVEGLDLELEDIEDEMSISSLDQMVSSLMTDSEEEEEEDLPEAVVEDEYDEELEDLEEPPAPPEPDDLDDIEIPDIEEDEDEDDEFSLNIDLDDISMEDFEKSLDELAE